MWIYWGNRKAHLVHATGDGWISIVCSPLIAFVLWDKQHWWSIHKRPKCKNCLRIQRSKHD
jgi:hypothetical protein